MTRHLGQGPSYHGPREGRNTMFAMLQCHLSQLKMGLWCSCHNYNFNRRIFHHLFSRSEARDPRMVLFSVIVGLRVPLDNRIELELWNDCYERYMEDFSRHAVTDDGGVVLFGHLHFLRELEVPYFQDYISQSPCSRRGDERILVRRV